MTKLINPEIRDNNVIAEIEMAAFSRFIAPTSFANLTHRPTGSECAFGRGKNTDRTRIRFTRHPQRATEGFEYRFCLVMRIGTTNVVDM
jgi:hypothetical protein